MRKKITQSELKSNIVSMFQSLDESVKNISFDTRMFEDKPAFFGLMLEFENGEVDNFGIKEAEQLLQYTCHEQGYDISDIRYNMGTRKVGDKVIPVFRGVEAEWQEATLEEPTVKRSIPKAKSIDFLADMRRAEQIKAMENWNDRELCEVVRAHFESHPTIPGEKNVKDFVNDLLDHVPNQDDVLHGLADGNGNIKLDPEICRLNDKPTREDIIQCYADTRIRETKMDQSGFDKSVSPDLLKIEQIDSYENSVVSVHKADIELQKSGSDVYILAELEGADTKYATIGKLPDKFVTNNPMNVESCKAELQIVDYSNGNMKNTSIRVVVDSDLMSGDAIDMDDDMLAGLDQTAELEQ